MQVWTQRSRPGHRSDLLGMVEMWAEGSGRRGDHHPSPEVLGTRDITTR